MNADGMRDKYRKLMQLREQKIAELNQVDGAIEIVRQMIVEEEKDVAAGKKEADVEEEAPVEAPPEFVREKGK